MLASLEAISLKFNWPHEIPSPNAILSDLSFEAISKAKSSFLSNLVTESSANPHKQENHQHNSSSKSFKLMTLS